MKGTGKLPVDKAKEQETAVRSHHKGEKNQSLQEKHVDMLKNIQSANIGKPTIVEAQRILKIIDLLYFNLQIFTYIDADFVSKFLDTQKTKFFKDQNKVNLLSDQVKELLSKQATFEQKYKPYASMQDQAQKEDDEKDPEDDKKLEGEKIYKQLENNFKELLRHLRNNQNDFEIIKSIKANINPDLNDLVHCIQCQRVIMLKKLCTAAVEEETQEQELKELEAKIFSADGKRVEYENSLNALVEQRQKFNKSSREEYDRLRNEIQEVKAEKKKKAEELARTTEQALQRLEKEHKAAVDKLEREKKEQIALFEKFKTEHTNEEKNLKTKKNQSDNQLEDNIRTYDSMMEEQNRIIDELKQEIGQNEKELNDLKEYFRDIDEKKMREKALQDEFDKKMTKRYIEQQKKDEAVKHIQIAYKAYKLKSKGRKKKRGKKK